MDVQAANFEQRIRDFINDSFPPADGDAGFPSTRSLLESGTIDSMGVLTLVTWLEEEFGITVDDEDVVPENLDSIASIDAYLAAKLEAAR
jgi:acyl carrier protein